MATAISTTRLDAFLRQGWYRFSYDERLARWAERALPAARSAVGRPEHAQWWRCNGTWFVGVHALTNDTSGALDGGDPIEGSAVDFVRDDLGLGDVEWDRAQVSVVYPGYPKRMDSESQAAFRFRRLRDAAHVDGILKEPPAGRRYLRQYHQFILGIPMVETDAGAAPLVVWSGSHEHVRAALLERFRGLPSARWRDEDITELYRRVRQTVFETCERIELVAQPGEAYLVHRLALHGIAPWSKPSKVGAQGRIVVYFRPETAVSKAWLVAP